MNKNANNGKRSLLKKLFSMCLGSSVATNPGCNELTVTPLRNGKCFMVKMKDMTRTGLKEEIY